MLRCRRDVVRRNKSINYDKNEECQIIAVFFISIYHFLSLLLRIQTTRSSQRLNLCKNKIPNS